ncbi:type II secretion system F family protein [Candidatus Woesearchaeota archaeon]|nr:type II secretion system F family protein [Candidatus Woesearchaeota archaeon]
MSGQTNYWVIKVSNAFFRLIASMFPELKTKLVQADMPYDPETFVKRTFMSSFMLSFGFSVLFIGGMLSSMGKSIGIAFLLFPVCLAVFFNYFIKAPDVKIKKSEKAINKEIVFASRFMIIEIESGVPIYNCFINLSKVYPAVGKYLGGVVDRVNMGTSIEDAINEAIELVPSGDLRKVLWQILNAIKTGADVTDSLSAVLEQIIKEQKIEVEEYGRKLNPLAMFYMLIAVIIPSLGTTMLIIFSSFIGFRLSLPVLLTIAGLVGFMQFMFYAMIKSSRPAVEL